MRVDQRVYGFLARQLRQRIAQQGSWIVATVNEHSTCRGCTDENVAAESTNHRELTGDRLNCSLSAYFAQQNGNRRDAGVGKRR